MQRLHLLTAGFLTGIVALAAWCVAPSWGYHLADRGAITVAMAVIALVCLVIGNFIGWWAHDENPEEMTGLMGRVAVGWLVVGAVMTVGFVLIERGHHGFFREFVAENLSAICLAAIAVLVEAFLVWTVPTLDPSR